jgi:hypothetical protein
MEWLGGTGCEDEDGDEQEEEGDEFVYVIICCCCSPEMTSEIFGRAKFIKESGGKKTPFEEDKI